MRPGRCACSQTISSAIPRRSFAARPGRQSDDRPYRASDLDRVGRSGSSWLQRTAPSRFYTLDSTAIADGAPAAHAAVMVGPVTVPAAVDQPQFVVQVAPNRVEVDEFNRWVAPLSDTIARAVAGDLVVLLGYAGRGHGAAGELQSCLPGHDRRPALRVDSRPGGDPRSSVDCAQDGGRGNALGPHGRARSRAGSKASTRSPPRTAAQSQG